MGNQNKKLNSLSRSLILLLFMVCTVCILLFVYLIFRGKVHSSITKNDTKVLSLKVEKWIAPDINLLGNSEKDLLIKYGKELISNTAFYFGSKGKISRTTNGMNCQNCHLGAGTKLFGNNYSAVAATYPKFRERSGTVENVMKRINDCFERSLNGNAIDTNSKEMIALKEYILWVGKDAIKDKKPEGAGIVDLNYLTRATNPKTGKNVYVLKCKTCHGKNGEGILNPNQIAFQYPPLWGRNSYNIGAGLFRISRFAGFVKDNMPFGASHANTQLTDEEAWDVAAFVNSQPRPQKDLSKDWPNITKKPVDHPFGPYADNFSETQHKYGPFKPIAEFKKRK